MFVVWTWRQRLLVRDEIDTGIYEQNETMLYIIDADSKGVLEMSNVSLTHASASHTRWQWLFGQDSGPFTPAMLKEFGGGGGGSKSLWTLLAGEGWNSGQYAPVTLMLAFSAPISLLKLCPRMRPCGGPVSLVVVLCDEGAPEKKKERIALCETWEDEEWVSIDLPRPSACIRIEFVSSPSWIALYAVLGV